MDLTETQRERAAALVAFGRTLAPSDLAPFVATPEEAGDFAARVTTWKRRRDLWRVASELPTLEGELAVHGASDGMAERVDVARDAFRQVVGLLPIERRKAHDAQDEALRAARARLARAESCGAPAEAEAARAELDRLEAQPETFETLAAEFASYEVAAETRTKKNTATRRRAAYRSRTMKSVLTRLALCLALFATGALAWAGSSDVRWYSASVIRSETGTAVIDSAAGDWTGFRPVLTVTPIAPMALSDVVVVFDLSKASTGWAATATSETITFVAQRAVDGTNFCSDLQTVTAAVSGTASSGRSVTLHIGLVAPGEGLRIAAKVSAETNGNPELPYLVYYLAPMRATFTPSN